MTDEARHFLVSWFSDHVEGMPAALRLAEVVRLATQCRKDATASGIPLQEIRDAAGGDLIRKILEALNVAARLDNAPPLAPEAEQFVKVDSAPADGEGSGN